MDADTARRELRYQVLFTVVKFLSMTIAMFNLALWISMAIFDVTGLTKIDTADIPLQTNAINASIIGSIAFYLIMIAFAGLQLYGVYREKTFVAILFAILYNIIFAALTIELCLIGSIVFFVLSATYYLYAFLIRRRSKLLIEAENRDLELHPI